MKLDKDMVSYLTRFVDSQNFRMDILDAEIARSKENHTDKFVRSVMDIIKQQNKDLIEFVTLFEKEN